MSSTFLYYWRTPDGTLHTTTDPDKANTALHSPSHPCIHGTRLPQPPDHPLRPLEPDDEEECPQ